MAELLFVPEVAAGATEVVISEWLVEPGQTFRVGDPLVVIETEKAVVEVEAEAGATVLKLLVAPGTQIDVGSPMALLGAPDDVDSDVETLLTELGASTATVAASGEPPERPAPPSSTPEQGDTRAATPDPPATGSTAAATPAHSTAGSAPGRRFISPIARKRLREAELDIDAVTGTGPDGRIVRRDVEDAIAAASKAVTPAAAPEEREPAAAAPPTNPTPAAAPGGWVDVPHSRLRKAVAGRLTRSKQDIPHFYLGRSAAIDELLALRARLNEVAPAKISVNDFIIRAVALAHRDVPEANVIFTDEALRHFETVDIAVAIASERGLVTPVLRGVESSSLSAISASVKTFADQAGAGRLQQKDLEGGSITVTNLGMFGVEEFAAIINPPQSAILAVGAGLPTPRVVDGTVAVQTVVRLVLSVDHRALDGALAARWMSALVCAIENPFRLVV